MMDNSVSPSGTTSPASLYKRASRALGVTALLAVLAVGLLLLLPGGLAWAQDAETIKYAENGDGVVATFTAVDPEGESVTWVCGDRRLCQQWFSCRRRCRLGAVRDKQVWRAHLHEPARL